MQKAHTCGIVLSIPCTLNFRWQPVTSKTNDRDASFDRETSHSGSTSRSPFRRETIPRSCQEREREREREREKESDFFVPSSKFQLDCFPRGVETPAFSSRCFFIKILGRSAERSQEACTIRRTIRNSSRAIDTSDPVCRPVFRLFAPLLSLASEPFPRSWKMYRDTLSFSLSPVVPCRLIGGIENYFDQSRLVQRSRATCNVL